MHKCMVRLLMNWRFFSVPWNPKSHRLQSQLKELPAKTLETDGNGLFDLSEAHIQIFPEAFGQGDDGLKESQEMRHETVQLPDFELKPTELDELIEYPVGLDGPFFWRSWKSKKKAKKKPRHNNEDVPGDLNELEELSDPFFAEEETKRAIKRLRTSKEKDDESLLDYSYKEKFSSFSWKTKKSKTGTCPRNPSQERGFKNKIKFIIK